MGNDTNNFSKLTWDESYAVGVQKFDEQHQVLFDYINDLREATMKKDAATRDMVGWILDGLVEYAMNHFMAEEVDMCRYDYPGFQQHKSAHDRFIETVRDLLIQFKTGKTSDRILCSQINAVLTDWLLDHIMKVDKAYTPFLQSKGLT